jgi:transcriptional regulator with XRE-family HTH domain
MNNKIKNILLTKDMSPSRFADEIGVQRSSISHILSGRNKPSLEIIQKIVRRFPELGSEWIFEEDDSEEEAEEQVESGPFKNAAAGKEQPGSANGLTKDKSAAQLPLQEDAATIDKRKVERILIFYSDKTFTEYKPE